MVHVNLPKKASVIPSVGQSSELSDLEGGGCKRCDFRTAHNQGVGKGECEAGLHLCFRGLVLLRHCNVPGKSVEIPKGATESHRHTPQMMQLHSTLGWSPLDFDPSALELGE